MAALQVYEHQEVRVGEGGFTESHYQSLCRFYERLPNPYFSLLHRGVRFNYYVGVLQVGDLTIEILPKLSRPDNGSDARWQTALIEMLRTCKLLKVDSLSSANLSIRPHAILELYFELFIEEVEKLLRQGLLRQYRRRDGKLEVLKGRLLLHKQMRTQFADATHFYTEYEQYSYDNHYNRILRAGLDLLQQFPLSSDLSARLSRLLQVFPPLTSPNEADRRSWASPPHPFTPISSRKTDRYRTALEVAQLLLHNYHPALKPGPHHTLALLFDMNLLFEEYIYRKLLEQQTAELSIARQLSRPFWGRRFIKPDIVIEHKGERLVLDTKWKTPGSRGPSMDDLRQMLAYARQFGARRGIIVYPRSRREQLGYSRPYANPEQLAGELDCQIVFVDLLREGRLNEGVGGELLGEIMVRE